MAQKWPDRARAYATEQAGRARDFVDAEVGPGAGTKKVYVKAAPIYNSSFGRTARVFFLCAFGITFLMSAVSVPVPLVRIGVMMAWLGPIIGCCGTSCAQASSPCRRRLGVLLLGAAGAVLLLRSLLTFLSFELFWPSFGLSTAQTATQAMLSFCGGAADVVIFVFGMLLYCTYSRQLASTFNDKAPRQRPSVKVRSPERPSMSERRESRRASWEQEASERRARGEVPEDDEDLDDLEGGVYEGPDPQLEPDAAAWTVDEVQRVRAELLALEDTERRARLRELRRQYHPDKNKGKEDLVTPVFQYIQMWYEDTED